MAASNSQAGPYKNQALFFFGDVDFGMLCSPTVQIQLRWGFRHSEGLAATQQFVEGLPFMCGLLFAVGTP